MKALARLSSYEDLELTITLTAPVQDWRVMRKRLTEAQNQYQWPLSSLTSCIDKSLEDLDRTHENAVAESLKTAQDKS